MRGGVACAALAASLIVGWLLREHAVLAQWPLALAVTVGGVAVWALGFARTMSTRAAAGARALDQSDRSLRTSEARQRAILESARDAILTVDDTSRICELNHAAVELFGHARSEMIGKPIDILFPPELLPAVQAGRARYRSTGASPALERRMELRAQRADGREFPAEFTFSRVTDVEPLHVTVCVRDITDRKETAERLRRSAERFRTIIETSREMVSIVAADGTILYVSKAVRSVLGYEPEELVGASTFAFVHPDEQEAVREHVAARSREAGSSGTVEYRLRHKDGSWCALEAVTRNLLDDPDVRGLVYFARDVTERQRAEREVRLLATVEAAIAAASDTGAALEGVLQPVCEALGWQVGELWTPSADGAALRRAAVWHETSDELARFAEVGRTLVLQRNAGPAGAAWTTGRAQHVRELALAPELMQRAGADAGLSAAACVPVLAADRPLALLLFFAPTAPASDERLVELVAARLGAFVQRHQADDARRVSEALNRAVLSSLGAHIAVLDRQGVVITVNDAWRRFALDNGDRSGGRLTGVGMNYLDICAAAPDDPAARAALHGVRDVLRGTHPSFSLEYPCPTPEGERRWFELTATPLLGERRGAVLSHSDVTERKRAEEALVAAREAAFETARIKDEFIANLSHELRTPLTAIIGMNMLALESELTPEQREFLNVVQSSSAALLELINELLDFSRIDLGRLRIEHVAFDLRQTIGTAMKALAVRAHAGLEVTWEVGTDVPDGLVGDPGRLRQILANLVGNAIKFTPSGKVTVRVASEPTAGGVLLDVDVADTGIGIPPEFHRRIFDPFVQGDGSSTRRYGGTGIGLAITVRLVELMGGTMRVESEVGRGSSFRFTIPMGVGEPVRSTPTGFSAPRTSAPAGA